MADTFTFVRHMMKLSDPEAIQAAIQAGTLAEPYIINITQDSSVSGYESKGIYIQESSTGTPSMNVKEYEEPQQNWWEEVDWNQDGVVLTGENISVRETLESFADGYETDLLGEDVVLLINPTFANGQLSGGRAVHFLQDEENENGRYFVNANLQAGVPCYIACMNDSNYVLSAVCEEEYDLDGINYYIEYDEYKGTPIVRVVVGECYGPNTPVPDSSADWYQLYFAENYNDSFYDYSEERFSDISELAEFIDSDVYMYMFETTTAAVALVIDGSFNDGYVSGGTCVPGTFTADTENSGTFRFENCQISDSSTVMLLIDAYGEEEWPYDTSINVRYSKFVVGAAPFGYNITNGVEWSVSLEINADTGDTTIVVGEITDIGDESGDSSTDSSTDVSLGYKFTVGQDNSAYFNTDYYPTANTVVQLKGIIQPDGNSSHGIAGNVSSSSEWTYRIFGYGGSVYCDRETSDTSYRLFASVENLDSSVHEYEFGNLYIKVDGSTVATSQTSMANYDTPNSPMFVFAGSVYNKDNDEIGVWHLAPAGTELEYIKFLEPDASGNLQLMMDLRPGIEWPDENKVLYDMVSGDVIYPTGQYNAIEATALDSSSGGDSSTEILSFTYEPAEAYAVWDESINVLDVTTTMDSSTYNNYHGVYYLVANAENIKNEYYYYIHGEEPAEGEEVSMPSASEIIDYYVANGMIPTEDSPVEGAGYDRENFDSVIYMETNPCTESIMVDGGSFEIDVDYIIIAIPAYCNVSEIEGFTSIDYYCDVDSPLISSETFTYSAPVVE